MEGLGRTPLSERVGLLAGQVKGWLGRMMCGGMQVGEQPEVAEGLDPDQEYSIREEALGELWLRALPEDVARTQDVWRMDELAARIGPDEVLAAFAPENQVLWGHPRAETIQNCVIDWMSNAFAQAERDGRIFGNEENSIGAALLARLGLGLPDQAEVICAWQTLSYSDLVRMRVEAGLETAEASESATTEMASNMRRNFTNMFVLERRRPGAVEALYSEFGIRSFGRYNPDDLLAQLTLERDDPRTPLSVVVSDAADHNGFFGFDQQQMVKRLLSKGQTVFIEASRGREALRRVVGLAHRFGPIDQLVLAAHATESAIGDSSSDVLTTEDVNRARGLGRLKEAGVLGQRAVAMFYGCRAGAQGGIATAFAKHVGIPTLAFEQNLCGFDWESYMPDMPIRPRRQADDTPTTLAIIQPTGERIVHRGAMSPIDGYSLYPARAWHG